MIASVEYTMTFLPTVFYTTDIAYTVLHYDIYTHLIVKPTDITTIDPKMTPARYSGGIGSKS